MRITFDRFVFDSERRELVEGTNVVHLGPKAFRLLEILIGNSPRALSKGDLYQQVWPGTFVDESNLAGLVNELRVALGDRARDPRYIRTVHGFGYAFCAEVDGGNRERRSAALVTFRGRALPLQAGINVLGRDGSADVQIDDPTVSRRHASITIADDEATLTDLDSKNGTFLDGEKLTGSAPLGDRQTFVLGDASVTFHRSRASTSTVTTA
jgi:DNA-binding winged helix-turn-helix (wHTH) protein